MHALQIGLWERPLGLAGVWGGLVRRWQTKATALLHRSGTHGRHHCASYLDRSIDRSAGCRLQST
jgi:hypothetical protein